jgi:hypothetical protein
MQPVRLSRLTLTAKYGLASQQAFGKVNKGRFCGRSVVFVTRDMNPDLPASAGLDGLLYCNRSNMLKQTWSYFCRTLSRTPALWEYLGEYHATPLRELTGSEFSSKSDLVILLFSFFVFALNRYFYQDKKCLGKIHPEECCHRVR